MQPGSLLTFVGKNGYSMSHGLPVELLSKQAQALGISQVLEPVTWGEYEEGFQRAAGELKKKGFTGGVFGDINLPEHRTWLEKACQKASLNCYLPLWGLSEEDIIAELLARGAELMIVAVRKDLLDIKWLGRLLDESFIRELKGKGLSLCGERGEYHTLVIFGPLFKKRVDILFSGYRSVEKVAFLNYKMVTLS